MLSDLRFALRQLARSPGFTAVAVLTLALCIGANSAVFSLFHAILLRPYPWPDAERLVYCYNSSPLSGRPKGGASIPDYLDRRAGVHGFADAALLHYSAFNFATANTSSHIAGMVTTPSLFTTLQTGAALGRVFTADDARPGHDRVVVLSHAFWKTNFAADPSILGRAIRLNTEPYTVIGVMPEGFDFPNSGTKLWVPFAFTAAQCEDGERGHEFAEMLARLAPGATAESVQRELDIIQARNAERLPDHRDFWTSCGFCSRTESLRDNTVASSRPLLWLLQASVAAALLIGCANVANLLLARTLARGHELAVRSALGAGRGRIVRLLLTETLVLFLAGGLLGLLLAYWCVGAFSASALASLPGASEARFDGTIFAFTLLCALGTGLVAGVIPAWAATHHDPGEALKETGARASASRRTHILRAALACTEIGLAVILLTTTGLLLKSYARLQGQSPGLVTEHVLTARLSPAGPDFAAHTRRAELFARLIERSSSLPGVTSAALATNLPFGGGSSSSSFTIAGREMPWKIDGPRASLRFVSPAFFCTLGIPLLRGREFTAADDERAPGTVIVDRAFAERYWPGGDPLGQVIVGGDGPGDKHWTIVGVVATTANTSFEERSPLDVLYFPLAQVTDEYGATLVLKTAVAPETLTVPLRALMTAVDPDQPLFDIRPMADRLDETLEPRRAPLVLLAFFGAVALLLAALGVYGVLAFSVAQRSAEFGIRRALGATTHDLARLVLRHGLQLVVVGLLLGLVGHLALGRILASYLWQVDVHDPVTLVLAPALLALVALLACWAPARRAARVDPMIALRAE